MLKCIKLMNYLQSGLGLGQEELVSRNNSRNSLFNNKIGYLFVGNEKSDLIEFFIFEITKLDRMAHVFNVLDLGPAGRTWCVQCSIHLIDSYYPSRPKFDLVLKSSDWNVFSYSILAWEPLGNFNG